MIKNFDVKIKNRMDKIKSREVSVFELFKNGRTKIVI